MSNFLYDYFLPEKNLAKTPSIPRDSSKLFVYKTKTNEIFFDRFYHLDKYLPKNSFLVLNETKVIPARVVLKKENGGKVVCLFLVNEMDEENKVKVIVDRKVKIGEKLFFKIGDFVEVVFQEKNIFLVFFNFSKEKLFSLLQDQGVMPVPLYLKDTPLSNRKLKEKYQTIFFKKEKENLASVAAPTASLHFTNRVFNKLEQKGIKRYFVNLYVGMGTFAPVSEENLKNKKLHEEYYQVDDEVWGKILDEKKDGKKLVAVGTTVVRTLESLKLKNKNEKIKIYPPNRRETMKNEKFLFKTDLFIFPPYNFKIVDAMITNFHLPKSSLMMLVEAFLQGKGAKKHLIELYNIAIKNDFRFYSFGDAMLII
jgi:S-adenosylmethionine:tRNA ribosyltransferase-isomerase